ncbi:phosphatidylinositol kinase domain protein,putative [Trypanosoma brucei gambiense DAL972]|uniref:non-specific serine/threonine protein kinase n=1 Tax=Trypanosoma brucei gambiense (strain MHOM/CI/86/DAL972) TaxID=679716 RepID=C9ZJ04_TRYB9|nr:phosphatidylinositol kinase domain protein,putative [Trypanosoma brucei gambiense DAL972]CBH09362.1 phosphatidylinositol kinase domain protein,putative [Trypanosoma brucei gambiense DAL972]|eukprot:XP_011771668.1 phosphatidylinositol kinase domain protein,putative [Trypanosoma brucei gambiense DAL972]
MSASQDASMLGLFRGRHPAVSQRSISLDKEALKRSLTTICNDLQGATIREAPKFLQDLRTFLDNTVEQSCMCVQDLFGQHVANNILFVVMNSVLRPALQQYNEAVTKRRQMAALGRVNIAEDESGTSAYSENRGRKLRTDFARPWRALIETVHHNLPASVVQQQQQTAAHSSSSSFSSMLIGTGSSSVGGGGGDTHSMSSGFDTAKHHHGGDGRDNFTSSSFKSAPQHVAPVGGGEGWGEASHHIWAVPPNHAVLPLLWKNAVPLNGFVSCALEVLQSEVLSPVCGQEFAQLLLHLFLFDGYLSNLLPKLIAKLTVRLLDLIDKTVYEANGSDAGGGTGTWVRGRGAPPAGGCGNSKKSNRGPTSHEMNDDGDQAPSVEEGTTYAAVLVQLFRAPHLLSAFMPSQDTAVAVDKPENNRKVTLPFVMQQLVNITMRRHQRPTCALRLEEHLLVAVNLLIKIARDDYPLTSGVPLDLLKPLCHFFYATTRRDGWRLEALTLLTTQVCASFSAVLGQNVRADIERNRPRAAHHHGNVLGSNSCSTTGNASNHKEEKSNAPLLRSQAKSSSASPPPTTSPICSPTAVQAPASPFSVSTPPRTLVLLHETVLPFMRQLFTVPRSEFNFVSRRELSHFPCRPLASLFDFGAIVLYLACSTHDAYLALLFTSPGSRSGDGTSRHSGGDSGGKSGDRSESTGSNKSHDNGVSTGRKRPREGDEGITDVSDQVGFSHDPQPVSTVHPSNVILQLFRSLFFLESGRDAAETPVRTCRTLQGSVTGALSDSNLHRCGSASFGLGAGGHTPSSSTSSGGPIGAPAVQNNIKDSSLFMLHLLAQPCATLGFTEHQCTYLVEQGILPIFPYYGVQLESLLLAVLHAVGPRSSVVCQQELFRWLIRRYFPTETAQREEESHPKEQVYSLLSLLLERGVVGQCPFLVTTEERMRLHSAVHFSAITARIYAVVGGGALPSTPSTGFGGPVAMAGGISGSGVEGVLPLNQPLGETFSAARRTGVSGAGPSLLGPSASAAFAPTNNAIKTGIPVSLFKSMMQFLSAYHHYGATAAQITASHRVSMKKRVRDGCSQSLHGDQLMDLPTASLRLSTVLSFVVAGISHGVCFFPHDDGLVWRQETDSPAAVARAAEAFESVLSSAEDHVLSLCLIITESTMGCQHSLVATATSGVKVTTASEAGTDSANFLYNMGGGRSVASLRRIREKLGHSRRLVGSAFTTPEKQLPASVCEAARGHWLLLYEFLSLSREEVLRDMQGPSTTGVCSGYDICGQYPEGTSEGSVLDVGGSRLRPGDTPAAVMEALSAEVVRAVTEMACSAKIATTSAGIVGTEPSAYQQQQGMCEETVALIHRKLCIHSIQVLHFILRLYRLGIWHLPEGKCSRQPGECTGAGVVASAKSDGNANLTGGCSDRLNSGDNGDSESEDLRVLLDFTPQQLFEQPASVFQRLPTPPGRIYYAVMWLCHYLTTRLLRDSLTQARAVLRALLLLLHDVGTELLSRSLALWEPRQTILRFVGATCRRLLNEGISRLASWKQTEITTTDSTIIVQATMRLSCRVLGEFLTLVRHKRLMLAAAEPLVDPSDVTAVIVDILVKNELILPLDRISGRNDAAEEGADTRAILKPHPFVPFVLASVDCLAYLLQLLRGLWGDMNARNALLALLETLFARYAHSMCESIFATFGYYALHTKGTATVAARYAIAPAHSAERCEGQQNEYRLSTKGVGVDEPEKELLCEEGQMLKRFVERVSDSAQSDIPPLTPQRQCAVISAIYGLLFLCDAQVAEKLGRYIFSFFSPDAPYAVRQHTALQVRFLFSRFSDRAGAVMRDMIASAREGMNSTSGMSCATSLRAVAEAARAVPLMEPRVVCKLLECWATHGFMHKDLILECLQLIGEYARLRVGGSGVADNVGTLLGSDAAELELAIGEGSKMSAQQLCHHHRERLLFDWLWSFGHPLEALPITCFGFSSISQLWAAFMPLLLPIVLLCCSSRGSNSVQAREAVEDEAAGAVFMRPSSLLWRLAIFHHRQQQREKTPIEGGEKGDEAVGQEPDPECTPQLLIECIVAHFPDVVARLLLFASLSEKSGMGVEWSQLTGARVRCGHQSFMGLKDTRKCVEEPDEDAKLEEAGCAARVALEWLRSALSHRFASLMRYNADGILCRFVDLVGTLSPYIELKQIHWAVKLLCESIGDVASSNTQQAMTEMRELSRGSHPPSAFDHQAVHAFFSNDGGDHAYVLLQRLYVCLTQDLNRGARRLLLVRMFRDIVGEWWSRDLLQQVPHMLHTVLRMCGNMLMTCPDVRPVVCEVLLHVWSVVVTTPATAPSAVCIGAAADEAFISTIMSSLTEESRVVSSTWDAMKRSRRASQGSCADTPVEFINVDNEEEEVAVSKSIGVEQQQDEVRQQDQADMANSSGVSAKGPARRVARVLSQLENVILVSGAPASSFYDDVASAVDRDREAFVALIRLYRLNEQQRLRLSGAGSQRVPNSTENVTIKTASVAYNTCCRAVQHLLTVVCSDTAGQSAQSTVAVGVSPVAVAAPVTVFQTTNRDAQLSAFHLLRAICWCFIESGCESCVESLFSPTADIHSLLQQRSLDEALHHVYRQHLEQLYRLSFDADACNAHIASTTLRGWLTSIKKEDGKSINEGDPFSEGATVKVETLSDANDADEAPVRSRRKVGGSATLIRRTLQLFEKDGEEQRQTRHNRGNQHLEWTNSFVSLGDLAVFCRELSSIPRNISAVRTDAAVEQLNSLRSSLVWDALQLHEDEPRFLRLFLIAIIRQYKLQERLGTISTVLNCMLLPVQITPKGITGGNSSLTWFIEGFLPITLLHVILLKETSVQREERATWSGRLEECLFKRAQQFPHTTRLFLRALNICRSVIMTAVRSRGVRSDASDYNQRGQFALPEGRGAAEVAGGITFPPYVRSEYGDPPEINDMKDSYWLSDIDPLTLAAAAAACHEPHLAVLFTELSGESLLGRRKGIPSTVADISAASTRGLSADAHKQKETSVLFPSVNPDVCRRGASDGRPRQLRADVAQAELALRLFNFRSAVHAILVDVKEALRLREGNYDDLPASASASSKPTLTSTSAVGGTGAASRLAMPAQTGAAAEEHTTPWEEAFLLQHPMRRIEQEKSRGNWQAVLCLLDRLEHPVSNNSSRDYQTSISDARIVIEKANALLHLGDPGTALHLLASALKRKFHTSFFGVVRGSNDHIQQPVQDATEEEERHENECMQLRAALAGALWRSGRWDLRFLQEDGYQQQRKLHDLLLPTTVTVDEGIYHALQCVRRGDRHDAHRWCAQAQQHLLRQLNPSNWRYIMLRAEALQQIEDCGKHEIRVGSARPPRWVGTSLAHVRLPYDELQLLDSVQQQLCVVCKQPQWWLTHLEVCSERALCSNKPLLVRQWVSSYAELSTVVDGGVGGGSVEAHGSNGPDCNLNPVLQAATSSCGLPASVLIALVHARAEFACGYPHRAIAILQNIAAPSPASPQVGASGDPQFSFLSPFAVGVPGLSFPKNPSLMPPVVLQLVAWVTEARLVPLSQIVRDPFFTRCAIDDRTGYCSLQLARLCHTLTRDIAERLRSYNYRTMQKSMESLIHTRTELQQKQEQLSKSGVSREEKNLLRRRISGLIAEHACDEREFVEEAESYALYRRSALNGYSRFLQLSGHDGDDNDILAVFGFVSLWLHQDESYVRKDTSPATDNVISKAISNTPLHKFLPLYSQLVAQLGTSLDNKNLETLVHRVATEQPLRAVWPLLALANGHVFGPGVGDTGGKGASSGGVVHVVDEEKVAIARRILTSLKEPSAQPWGKSKSTGSSKKTSSDAEDASAFECRRKFITDAESLSEAYIQLAFHRADAADNVECNIPKTFMLISDALQDLSIPPPTLTVPATNSALSASLLRHEQDEQRAQVPRVMKYKSTFRTPGGINVPKVLRCVLSDGRTVQQLLKSQDDLRQDSLIQQVFGLSNALFEKHPLTRQLHIYTYNVVPLAPTVGLIEWVDGTIPLDRYLNSSSSKNPTGAHERYFPTEITSKVCRARLNEASKTQKHAVLLSLYAEFSPALHYFFLEHFFTPQEWLQRREAYTRSVAASSMLGYILGLGDRHANNLLLHVGRAELVHIDLGFAFDQGKLLHVPELVPFRLTRNIVDGFGVQGTEGPFRHHCQAALQLLRGQKEFFTTILAACAHDPLSRWAVSIIPPQQQQQQQQNAQQDEQDSNGSGANSARQQGVGVHRKKPTYADAERVLSRVMEKIQGYESGELLSVRTHVQKLLQTAQNTELLAQMFHGWSPWL